MKRFFSVLTAICVIASLSACQETETVETGTTTAESTAPVAADTVTETTTAESTAPVATDTVTETTTAEITTTTAAETTTEVMTGTATETTTSSATMPSETTTSETDNSVQISEAFTPGYDPGPADVYLDISTREILPETKQITFSVNCSVESEISGTFVIEKRTPNGWETVSTILADSDGKISPGLPFICSFYPEDSGISLKAGDEFRISTEVNNKEYEIFFTVGAKNPQLKKEDIELYMPSALIMGEQDSFEIKYTYIGKHDYAEYAFGCDYSLEILNENGEWEDVPFAEDAGFIELAYLIGTESTANSTTVSLRDDFYAEPLKAGTYKVTKPMCDGITFTGIFRLNDGYPRLHPAPTDKDLKVAIKEVTDGTPITTNSSYLTLTIDYIGEYDYAEYMYGEYESLEKLVDGQWQKVEYADEVAWHDIGILVNAQCPGGRDTVPLDNDFYKEPLTAGKYRVVKEISDVTYHLEFEMTDEKAPPLKEGDVKVTLNRSTKNIKTERSAEFTLEYKYVGNGKNCEYIFDSSFYIEKRDPVSGEWKDFPFKEEMGFDDYVVTLRDDGIFVGETIYISEDMFKEPFTDAQNTKNTFRIVKPLCDGVEVTAVFMLYEKNAVSYPSPDDIKMTVTSPENGHEIKPEDGILLVSYEYTGKDDFAEYELISEFALEKLENNKWIKIAYAEEGILGDSDLIPIGTETPENETTIYPQFLSSGELAPGKYRLVQSLGKQSVSAEFTVKKPLYKLYNSDGQITLHIDEINKNGFICSLPWPYPAVYTVQCNADEYDDFCVGDNIEVYYESMYEISEYDFLIIPDSIEISGFELDPDAVYKPVIYLYPEKETDVSVTLDYNGELTVTYPQYNGGWNVTAMPDGTLYDENGNEYSYLFWEGVSDIEYDFSKGFCVRGEDTAEFLRYALSELGLTPREYNEFIVFWLPFMQDNEYNIISFQSDCYTDNAVLSVTPEPDTVIRVFMAFYPSNTAVEIEEQELSAPERDGFTVIEWGGTKINRP